MGISDGNIWYLISDKKYDGEIYEDISDNYEDISGISDGNIWYLISDKKYDGEIYEDISDNYEDIVEYLMGISDIWYLIKSMMGKFMRIYLIIMRI